MNIALTGSSGLIGSNLASDLQGNGHKVMQISSSHSNSNERVFSYDEIISEKRSLKVDCMIHLASINSNLSESQIKDEVYLSELAIKFMKVLDCRKIIFFSSIKVYGENSFENMEFTEESILNPICNYGVAKESCEKLIIRKSLSEGFSYFIFRLPPVFLNNPKSNLGKLFLFVEKRFPLPSFRIGDVNKRSIVSYEILLSGVLKLLDNQGNRANEIYNFSDSNTISTNDLIKKIANIHNRKPLIIYFPDFIFSLMMRSNKLQSVLVRIFGSCNISIEKFNRDFS